MLPTNQDSSNLVDEESKQPQGETQSCSPNKLSANIGIIFFVVIIYMIFYIFLEIENISSKPKLLAWCSYRTNKISIVELETKQEFTNFNGVKLSKTGSIFQLFISDSDSITIY